MQVLPACAEDGSTASGGQLGAEAVSQILTAYSSIFVPMAASVGGTNPSFRDIATITIQCTGAPIAIDAYCPITGGHTSGATSGSSVILITCDGLAVGSSTLDVSSIINAASIAVTPLTLSLSDTPAGTHTYALHAFINASGSTGAVVTLNFLQSYLKLREIKKLKRLASIARIPGCSTERISRRPTMRALR